jgi:uncharacterized membrane protein YczE
MSTKRLLQIFFVLVLGAMTWVTVRASLHENVITAAGPLLQNPWGLATLFDAYFGFLTFYLWLAYKEQRWWPRLYWLALVLALGNFAMAFYVLRELARLPSDAGMAAMLTRRYA